MNELIFQHRDGCSRQFQRQYDYLCCVVNVDNKVCPYFPVTTMCYAALFFAGAAISTSWSRAKMERLHNTGSSRTRIDSWVALLQGYSSSLWVP